MAKVMHVIGDLECGGAQRMFLDTVQAMRDAGNDSRGLVVSGRLRMPAGDGLVFLRLPRTDNILLRALSKAYEFPLLLLAIAREDPDVIYAYHSADDRLLSVLAARLLGKKVAVRQCAPKSAHHLSSRLLDCMSYRLCDRVVALSGAGVRELEASGIRKIALIPNGKDARRYRSALSRAAARKRLGIHGDELVIGSVGRICPVKDHKAAISALPEGSLFVIAGDSEPGELEALRSAAEKAGASGRLRLLGVRNDIPDILRAFDIFLHTSSAEGCSGAVMEAMCAGLPVVVFDEEATRQVVGGGGIVVRQGRTDELAAALKSLSEDPRLREKRGKMASREASRFSLKKMVRSYERLFRKMREEK
jgi:glycosyltransferase involved in cell wall biosynthesis